MIADKPATELRRGDYIWIGGWGWKAITSVRHVKAAVWVGGEVADAVRIKWRQGVQDVRADSIITVSDGR